MKQEKFTAPTPTRWKKIRNIAGLVAVVAGALVTLPISAVAMGVIGGIGGVALVISQYKTIDEREAEKMSSEDLEKVKSDLQHKKLNKPEKVTETEYKTLDVVSKELKNREDKHLYV